MLVRDLNAKDLRTYLSNFISNLNAKNEVKNYKHFKNVKNVSCINLFLKKLAISSKNTVSITRIFSYFHKMVIIVLKKSLKS